MGCSAFRRPQWAVSSLKSSLKHILKTVFRPSSDLLQAILHHSPGTAVQNLPGQTSAAKVTCCFGAAHVVGKLLVLRHHGPFDGRPHHAVPLQTSSDAFSLVKLAKALRIKLLLGLKRCKPVPLSDIKDHKQNSKSSLQALQILRSIQESVFDEAPVV